jgi:penicillin-binding protein 2
LASPTTERPRSRRLLPKSEAVVEPYRLTPRLTLRVGVLGVLVLLVFGALFLRLWSLQVLAGSKYLDQTTSNSYRTVRVQAPRGPVLDRNGKPLVKNVRVASIQLWPADLPKVYTARYALLKRISRVTGVPLYEIAAGIKRRRGDLVTPVIVREGAGKAMVNYLYEHSNEFPGVTIGKTYVRHYPYHSLGAQILGYVGSISESQAKKLKASGYAPNDEIGQSGVESAFDTYLRGVAGTDRLHVDSLGRPRSSVEHQTLAKPGHRLRLTLDLNLQKAAEKALQVGIQAAHNDGKWAANGGAIVALDPTDGSILAMASSPTYDPSVYSGRVSPKALASQGLSDATALKKNHPAINRAEAGLYPPGSVFKPVTALAAMHERLVSPYAYLPCTGTYISRADRSRQAAKQVFHNWDPGVNQAMDLPTAMAYSCDTYFYELGQRFYDLPPSRGQPLQKWSRAFGFGSVTGVDVGPEAAGLVPTIGWRQKTFTQQADPCCWAVDRIWKPGHSIQLAIGQGDLLVTPLQMARFYALIANGGKLVTPHLLMDVENPNKTAVPIAAPPAPRDLGIDKAALQVVQQGLWQGVHVPNGTSYGVFGSFPVSISGKTGTAEKVVTLPGYTGLQDQAWWCGYGPSDAAKLVVCVVIENGGHGGVAAAPAAQRVFSSFFNVKANLAAPIHSD